MTKVSASAALTREALHDAPEGEWLDSLLEKTNIVDDQVIRTLQGGFSIRENTPWKFVTLDLVHGVQYKVKNPFDDPAMPVKMISVASAVGLTLDSSGRPTGAQATIVQPQLTWRPTGQPDNSVFISANYELNHTQPFLHMQNSASQAIANNAAAPYTNAIFDTTIKTRGGSAAPTYNAGVFTIPEAGTYLVRFQWRLESAVYTDVEVWIDMTIGGATASLANADSSYQTITQPIELPLVGTPTFAAGGEMRLKVFQTNAAVAARNLLNKASGGSAVTIERLYNDTAPTGRVTLLFQGE